MKRFYPMLFAAVLLAACSKEDPVNLDDLEWNIYPVRAYYQGGTHDGDSTTIEINYSEGNTEDALWLDLKLGLYSGSGLIGGLVYPKESFPFPDVLNFEYAESGDSIYGTYSWTETSIDMHYYGKGAGDTEWTEYNLHSH